VSRRVVVTGLGVVAPTGNTVTDVELALRKGRSGLRRMDQLREHGFACQVAGVPQGVDELAAARFREDDLLAMNSNHRYAALAALDAWTDAGLVVPELGDDRVDWDSGAIVGTGIGGMDTIAEKVVPAVNGKRVRRLGGALVEQCMASGVSARVGGLLGLGNQVSSNSSACATGSEALVMGFERVRSGRATRMLCGGSEGGSHYTWAGFDSMRVLARGFNERPHKASRPLSASARGFVPGAGAGILMLEELEQALKRDAHIYAELAGGFLNSGGHRGGGSMTAPNAEAIRRCIRGALADSRVEPEEVDLVNGHLSGTRADVSEVRAWSDALGRGPDQFPILTATKSMIGHALGAAGGIESVASVLMLDRGFVHPCTNCEDLNPDLDPFGDSIIRETRNDVDLRVVAKAGFGFGDVNCCIVFKSCDPQNLILQGEF